MGLGKGGNLPVAVAVAVALGVSVDVEVRVYVGVCVAEENSPHQCALLNISSHIIYAPYPLAPGGGVSANQAKICIMILKKG